MSEDKQTRWVKFLGGNNLLYTLVVLLLMSVLALVLNQLDFIFNPILTILTSLLFPFLLSLVLYYLFEPAVSFLEKHHVPRIWGIALTYVVILALMVFGLMQLLPVLEEQLHELIKAFPDFIDTLTNESLSWFENSPYHEQLDRWVTAGEDSLKNLTKNWGTYLTQGLSGLGGFLSGVTNTLMTTLMAPIILFFLLKDGDKMFKGFIEKLPPHWRGDLEKMTREINAQVGSYVTGQGVIVLVNFILMLFSFWVIKLDFPVVFAVIGAITSIIPYVGPVVTVVPAALVALSQSVMTFILLCVAWAIIQLLQGSVINPMVMGKQLDVHPLTIIIVLFIAGNLMGIFGMIFGLPLYTIIRTIVTYFFQKFKARYNRFYQDENGAYEVRAVDDIFEEVSEE